MRNEVKPNGHRRAFHHDYCAVGTYMITIVTEGRLRLFGHIEGSARTAKQDREAWAYDSNAPHIVLSELGKRVLEEEVPKIAHYYPQVEVWRVAMMPDHIHLLLRVKETLPEGKHLGNIVRGFKTGCTRAWWSLQDAGINPAATPSSLPCGKAPGTTAIPYSPYSPYSPSTPSSLANPPSPAPAPANPLSSAPVPEASPSGNPSGNPASHRPLLFSPGYHDRIINRPGMLDNIKRYMLENPLRARIREECPHLMERQLHLWIGGREYAAFGNLFLLKYPMKRQVFFHRYTQVEEDERAAILAEPGISLTDKERERMATDKRVAPTHLTKAYALERDRLLQEAEEGTVLVTPGISKGESIVFHEALQQGLPLIQLQVRPIGRYWKPEEQRFYACVTGHLLILSPWILDGVSDYEHFHRLNDLASEICEATEMRIMDYSQLSS